MAEADAEYAVLASPIYRREVRHGLLRQIGRRFVRHRLALAGAVVIVVFFLAQRTFIQGITVTGLKG